MSNPAHCSSNDETAVGYAQAQKCFYDHQNAPYRFRDQIDQLKETIHRKGSDGLVEQSGLSTASFPQTCIDLDIQDGLEHVPAHTSPPPTQAASLIFTADLIARRKLRIPSESLELGYDPKEDVKRYQDQVFSKSSCNILNEWLPLSPVNIDNDEGILFSPASSRWQKLAQRELERETLDGPIESNGLLCHMLSHAPPDSYRKNPVAFGLRCPRTLLEPVSPLLSPSPELDDPFVPSPRVTIIDLTSEPSSPVDPIVARIQNDVRNDTLDSGPMVPLTLTSSSPPRVAQTCLISPKCNPFNAKVDVPLIDSSPLSTGNNHPFEMPTQWIPDNNVELEVNPSGSLGHFDEAIEAITEACRDSIVRYVEGERLDAKESQIRVQVPHLDFEVPKPGWHAHLSSPEAQFRWVNEKDLSTLYLESTKPLTHLALRWMPVPNNGGRVCLNEVLTLPGSGGQDYLSFEPPRLCSKAYVPKPLQLSILAIIDDAELDSDTSIIEDPRSSLGERNPQAGVSLATSNEQRSLDDILKSRFSAASRKLRRKASGELSTLLPNSTDSSATSKLLSSFLQLRCPKKTKYLEDLSMKAKVATRSNSKLVFTAEASQQPAAPNPNLRKPPTPEFSLPAESCRFIISTNLSRGVIAYIEKAWPRLELIDKDFSQYNEVQWFSGSTQRKELISSLFYEADISISPEVGVILTTMLKVKQKPLPGSNSPTPFRHRVQQVSQKYETLFILASEVNPQGEYVGDLSASDMAAFTDFVRFTSTFQAGVVVQLVHGAEETLSKWVLELMARFAKQSSKFAKLVSSHDTTWGLFLRHAGMNIFASHVLESLLTNEYGDVGMDRFIAMSAEERLSKYRDILGGTRVLTNVCRGVDK